jgi:feruloyl esterase
MGKQRPLPAATLTLAFALVPGRGPAAALQAEPRVSRSSATDCAALRDLRLPDIKITEAAPVAPGERPGPGGGGGGAVTVPHCRVTGVIGREIRFTVWLPDQWNQRFFMGGGGGFVGSVQNQAMATLNRGYATAGTDAGHQAPGVQAGWALHDLDRQVNYGHLAVHRTAETAKAIIRAYYGSEPRYSYFAGCSNGGRQALMEAQRYPDDFDGLVSGAPALDFTNIAAAFIRNIKAAFPNPATLDPPLVGAAALQLLEARVLEACDARDGVKDGVMDDPRDCDFKVASIKACPNDVAAADCLTRAQRAVIETVYAPTSNREGRIYPGQPFGGEGEGGGWGAWITGPNPSLLSGSSGRMPSLQYGFGTEFFKYFVFGDSTWDYTRYDLSTWARDTRQARSVLNADNPDLSALKTRGGKLILWHGWSDPALNALSTIDYYGRVQSRDPGVRDYARLFMVPGVLHCAGGSGPDNVDWFGAIADWVEQGKAPESLVASKLDREGKTVRSRPLCPYPERARNRGSGSQDSAASYACSAP